jgi:hypothetical protein
MAGFPYAAGTAFEVPKTDEKRLINFDFLRAND